MIFKLEDTEKAERLFEGTEDTLVLSCLQRVMGSIFVTDLEHPRSAMAYLGDFAFYAGEPDAELVSAKPEGFVIMVPLGEGWAELIRERFPDAEKETRFSIRKDTRFDRERLEAIAAAIPEGYELNRIDGGLYDQCLENELFIDCVKHFGSKERYFALGRGYAVTKDGKAVSVASSYTVYRGGIEIEIDTLEEERQRGFASAAGAKLILSCLDDGLYPSWDAANRASVRLAEKLGYEFGHEYECYEVE